MLTRESRKTDKQGLNAAEIKSKCRQEKVKNTEKNTINAVN